MKISYLHAYYSLRKKSLEIPSLVTKLEKRESDFVLEFTSWLKVTEDILRENHFPECSELAGLRSKILYPLRPVENRRASKRRLQMEESTRALYAAQHTLLEVITPLQNRIEEARVAVNQLLGVAYQADMVQWNGENDLSGLIHTIWMNFSTNRQLRAVTAKVLTLVNRADGLRLIAEEIELDAQNQQNI